MKTTLFSIFIILLSLVLESANLVTKTYEIESQPSIAQLNLKAESAAIRIVRDYAFLSAVGSIKNQNFDKECWKKYITNKKIIFDVSEVQKKIIKKTNKFYLFEMTFDPKLVNLSLENKEGFLLSCSKKLRL